jgi:hypothetical protein
MASKGKSAREVQEEVQRALEARRSQQARGRFSWLKYPLRVVAALTLISLVIWAGALVTHLTNGASVADSALMTLDDLQVAISCPQDYETVVEFLLRSEALPLDRAFDGMGAAEAIREVCAGNYESMSTR